MAEVEAMLVLVLMPPLLSSVVSHQSARGGLSSIHSWIGRAR